MKDSLTALAFKFKDEETMRLTISLAALTVVCGVLTTACGPRDRSGFEVVNETYVHQYGLEVPPNDWLARGRSGHIVTTLANGIVVDKNYTSGVLHGDSTYTFAHSNAIQRIETYDNEQLCKVVEKNIAGIPIKEKLYHPDRTKTVTTWFDNGSPQGIEEYDRADLITKGQYFNYDHQLESSVEEGEGLRLMRDTYGQLLSKDTITDGKMNLRETYHANGNLKEVTPYRKGVVEGKKCIYLPGGEPLRIEEWFDGKQNGITCEFQNGEKVSEIPFVKGLKHGVEKRYAADGNTVVEEISWQEGVKHGAAISHVGSKTRTQWYFEGKPVTEHMYEYMLGKHG